MTEIWTRQWHVEYGRHSGIPECCIEQFVEEYFGERPRHKKEPGLDYARCPRCAATDHRVQLHVCTPDCSFQRELEEHWRRLLGRHYVERNSEGRMRWQPCLTA